MEPALVTRYVQMLSLDRPAHDVLLTHSCVIQMSVFDLPLTSDARLGLAKNAGMEHYRGFMAMAR
jgi:hypothetical protein